MADLKKIVEYTNKLLNIQAFNDYCPNGLQIQGKSGVNKLVSGVTASLALIEAAIEARADALLVHHGYFWKGEDPVISGLKQKRIKRLLEHDISLLAYHLPLDGHLELGNNAALARQLGIQIAGVADSGPGKGILFYGHLEQAMTVEAFFKHISCCLQREPLLIRGGEKTISSIAWCTGGAQGMIEQAAVLGVDAYLSGEISEKTTHVARESGIHYFAAGHHATERYGPMALSGHLASHFSIEHEFIDIDNPA